MMKNKILALILSCVMPFLFLDTFAQDHQAKVLKKGISVGAQNQKSVHGGFVNIKDLEVVTLLEANKNSDQIDFVYAFGKTTGINLLTPSSKSMASFGPTYKLASEKWTVKNRGTLIYLENNKNNRSLFRSVKTNEDLEEAFEKAVLQVKEIEDYKRSQHGPNTRLSSLSVGDYFVFSSNSGRGYAIGRIVDLVSGYQGHIRIDLLVTNHGQ